MGSSQTATILLQLVYNYNLSVSQPHKNNKSGYSLLSEPLGGQIFLGGQILICNFDVTLPSIKLLELPVSSNEFTVWPLMDSLDKRLSGTGT